MLIALGPAMALPAAAKTFVVNSGGDAPSLQLDGQCDTGSILVNEPECTLRAALEESNHLGQPVTIRFDIADCPDGVCILSPEPGNPLPPLQVPTLIDGASQPGNASVCDAGPAERPPYRIILEGHGHDHGLRIEPGGDASVIRGLNLRHFGDGIVLHAVHDTRVECSFVGSDETGTQAGPGNQRHGILLQCGATGNIIGGQDPSRANLVSANGVDGVALQARTDCDPHSPTPTGNAVLGNQIGTTADGLAPLGNGRHGIALKGHSGADHNFIGISTNGETIHGNVIAANGGAGILLDADETDNTGSDHNLIVGNFIGTDRSGRVDLGNKFGGVDIIRGSNNRIGGPRSEEANRIAYNSEGIWITFETSVNNTIQQNSLYRNAGLGIALIDGGNGMQNAPAFSRAEAADGMITARYSVTASDGSRPVKVEFFIADDDNEEGRVLLARERYDHDGLIETAFPDPGLTPGSYLVATATDPAGRTSEFSLPIEVRIQQPSRETAYLGPD